MESFIKKVYQKIYILSAQAIDEVMEISGELSAMPNAEKELLDRVDSWMKDLKKQILNKIDSEMYNLYLATNNYIQKGFLGDIFTSVANFLRI